VTNENLLPGREYYNLLSFDLCPGGPGTGLGPFGLCIVTNANLTVLLDQLALPVGADPFHFVATSATQVFGPYSLAPFVAEAICIDVTGGVLGPASPVALFQVQ